MALSNLELYSFLFGSLGTLVFTYFWGRYFKLGLDAKDKIQALHNSNSFRIGGIINIIFIIILVFIFDIFNELPIFIIFFTPLILISTWEDFFQTVSVKIRFLIIFFTALVLVYSSESYLRDIDVIFLENIFANTFLSIVLTSFGILVACNAWNFIDGVNGLSSGLGAFTLIIFTIISGEIYVEGFSEFLSICAYVFLGFATFNLITGKMFLGDTGSYFLGILIGWSGVLIVKYNIEFSPWEIFLIIIYPATEITITVIRRLLNKTSPFKSDNLHLHSILYLILKNKLKFQSKIINSISGFSILALGTIPGIYFLYADITYPVVLLAVFIFFTFYMILYLILRQILKNYKLNKYN